MRIEQSGPAFKAAYMPSQILVLMPLGFGPFSFLDPLILLCPACTLLLQSSRLSRHAACLAPPWAADAPKSLLPRSSLGFARTPISKTPTTSQPAQMLQPPACLLLDAGSSASGEMPRLSKDAQTSPLPQMLHPGTLAGGRVEMPQQVRRRQDASGCCPGCCWPGCPSGALAHTHQQQQQQQGHGRLSQAYTTQTCPRQASRISSADSDGGQ